MRRSFLATFTLAVALPALAEEGMWRLDQLSTDQRSDVRITQADTSRLRHAPVRILAGGSGGTGSFASPNGLILTNHHVALDCIRTSTLAESSDNYVQNGFTAPSMAEELPCRRFLVQVERESRDVTADMDSVVTEQMDAVGIQQARQRKRSELERNCQQEKGDNYGCEVVGFNSGARSFLIVYEKLKDIRLAYAPELQLGFFGGDEMNFRFPRYVSDISILRAYVAEDGAHREYDEANVPYRPEHYFRVSFEGIDTFAAKIEVAAWDDLKSFNCEILDDARARTSDPGFELGDVVGLFLSYKGVPPGQKILEIDWDEGNPKGAVETFDLGQGDPEGNGLFQGVVTHEYENVNSTQTKKTRTTLTIEGLKGQCARVRDVTVSPGSGPDSAGGGSLRVTVDNPVFSESNFEVRATVTNLVSETISVELVYLTPTDSGLDSRKLPPECEVIDTDLVGCEIGAIPPGEGLSKVITYFAPQTAKARQISGKVALVVGEFAPIASYSTTVEPLK